MPEGGEYFREGRMPKRPEPVTAAKGKKTTMKAPGMPSNSGSHVPTRGEGTTATKGKHVDGMAKMITPMNDRDQIMGRHPVSAEPMTAAGSKKGA